MAVVVGGVGCGGNLRLRRYINSSNLFNFHNPSGAPSCSLTFSSKQKTSNIIMATTTSSSSKLGLQALPKQTKKNQHKVSSYEKIDKWMRDSVADIVRKLPESPLLINVYTDEDDNTTAEKAEEEKWISAKRKWIKGENPMPDGVIFVEQIEQEEGEGNTWGIVVQGQGEAPACYLLKTSEASSGFGLRCTHFCLVKVTSFRETALSQLRNSWLVMQSQFHETLQQWYTKNISN